ncbi:MAG: hypothetical protein GY829_10845, partial [Gammaproteobacteria bacterium]|nr:hypothetical protein [Gammaproteobacteria bacterium]
LAAVASAKGWFIDFESTEKSYSKPVLWQNNIMFTTLQAQDLDDSCDSQVTRTTQGYFVSLDDASAVHPDVDGVDGLTPDDRKINLKNTGIPSSPLLLYPDEGVGKLSSDVLGVFDITEDSSYKMVDKFLPISWEEVIE